MSCFRTVAFTLVASALLTGCGGTSGTGPQSGNPSNESPTETAVLGHATLKFHGKIQSNVSSNVGSVAVVGAAGAAFTELNYLPATTLFNSTIAYAQTGELWTYSNGQEQPAVFAFGYVQDYCFTHDGHILLSMFDNKTSCYQIFECLYDGSNLVRITSAVENHVSVSATSNNSAVLFSDGANLRTVSITGTNETVLGPGLYGKYSPDNTKIALLKSNGAVDLPYLMAAAGGTQTAFDASVFAEGATDLAWSPDGTKLAVTQSTTSGSEIDITDPTNNSVYYTVEGTSTFAQHATFAPDNKTLAFVQGSAGAGPFSLTTSSIGGGNPVTVLPANGTVGPTQPQWSPYYGPRAFVGSGGSMFTSAAGFLWSERGSGFCSLLSFTATTPADATITPETPSSSGSSLVFDLHADKITSLKYANGYYLTATTVSPNVSDCFVSFDSTYGTITTAVPFIQTKKEARPVKKVVGTVATYTGKFPAIYNGKGKNLAPSGATQVSLDLSTGKLVSWR